MKVDLTGDVDTAGDMVIVLKHLNPLGKGGGSANTVFALPSKRMDLSEVHQNPYFKSQTW